MTDTDAPRMGDRVREIVTGQVGVVTGRSEYLWGCEQLLIYVDDEKDKDGDPKTAWYDIGRLAVVERAVAAAIVHGGASARAQSGPDVPAPVR